MVVRALARPCRAPYDGGVTALAGMAPEERNRALRSMFRSLAARYDLMNALLSLGQDQLWRSRAAAALDLPNGGWVLDVGTGTGALALAVKKAWPHAQVAGLDVSPAMLARARAAARAAQGCERLTWLTADGLQLPFADDTFDAVTSAFLLRNIGNLQQAFAEMARVTRDAGRVVALEFSPEVQHPWGKLARLYLGYVAPQLGALVTGDGAAYRYLSDSIADFVGPGVVASAMRQAGLLPLRPRRLVAGLVVIHVAVRPVRCETVRVRHDRGSSSVL